MYYLKGVTCPVSHVKYIYIYFFLKDKVVKLIYGGSVINGAYPVSFSVGYKNESNNANDSKKEDLSQLFDI